MTATRSKINRQIPFILIRAVCLPPFPELRPGPDAATTSPCIPAKETHRGCSLPLRLSRSPPAGSLEIPRWVGALSQNRHRQSTPHFLPICVCPYRRIRTACPTRHPEIFRAMRVQQFGYTNIRLPHKLREPRDGQLQLFWVGPLWREQSALRHARRRSIRGYPNFLDGRFRGSPCSAKRTNFSSTLESRMGTGKVRTFVYSFGAVFFRDSSFNACTSFSTMAPARIVCARCTPQALVPPAARKVDPPSVPAKTTKAPVLRPNPPPPFLPQIATGFRQYQRTYPRATRQFVQPDSVLPSRSESCKTGNAASSRKQFTPQRSNVSSTSASVQRCANWQSAQARAFSTLRNDRDSSEPSRGQNSRLDVESNCNLRDHTNTRSALCQFTRRCFRRFQ